MKLCTKCQKEPQLPYNTYGKNCMSEVLKKHREKNVRYQKGTYKNLRVNSYYKSLYWGQSIITKEVLNVGGF